MSASTSPILRIKVTLAGIRPPIWRRLLVHEDTRLSRMHSIIQEAMGWDDYHLHLFACGHDIYEPSNAEDFDSAPEGEDEALVTLGSVLPAPKRKCKYVYDFGDDWVHEILLEERLPADARGYPRCIKGRRTCPPEDCGGPWRYESLLEVLQDPAHPQHQEVREWVGDDFDPERFDLEEVNRRLRKLST
jgi:hypothetical protein